MKTQIVKEEEVQTKGQGKLRLRLGIVAVVGIGAGVYGFKLGRQTGLGKGMEIGYIHATHELISAWKEHSEELRLSRGE